MKKWTVLMLSVVLMAGTLVPGAAAEQVAAPNLLPVALYGTVVSATDTQIEVLADVTGETIILNLSAQTYRVDAVTGQPASAAPKAGDRIVAYYGPMTTMSIPPQSPAVVIALNRPEKSYSPKYAVVEAIERLDGMVKVTTDNGGMIVTINEDAPIQPYRTRNLVTINNIDIGSELLLWYDIVAMSYPEQAASLRTVILGRKDVSTGTIRLSMQAGVASVNGQEVNLEPAPYETEDGTLMLPLRLICEALGYEIEWLADIKATELSYDGRTVRLALGETAVVVTEGSVVKPFVLDHAPTLDKTSERTFVCAAFFRDVLGVDVIVSDDHV